MLETLCSGSTEQRYWVIEACVSTGLPVWAGFKCRLDSHGELTVGYVGNDKKDTNTPTKESPRRTMINQDRIRLLSIK
jgi:hypothetical protein